MIRREGEQNCRRFYHELRPSCEDVTISEIYDFISEQYGFSKSITDEMCQYEIQLEKNIVLLERLEKSSMTGLNIVKKDINHIRYVSC